MGPGAAVFPSFGAHGEARRKRAVLALTLALHLLAAFHWMQQRRSQPAPLDAPRVVTILLRLPAERRRAPAPAPTPARAQAPARATRAAQATRPIELPPIAIPAPAEAAAPTSPAPTALAAPQPAPPADAAALARDAANAADGFTLGIAKRQAGRIDRELRGGQPGVPQEANTPWARFVRGLEAAHVENSMSAHLDSYTSPDGVVIYRHRVGGRVECYRTGSVGLGVAGARGLNDAGRTSCPTGVTWQREE